MTSPIQRRRIGSILPGFHLTGAEANALSSSFTYSSKTLTGNTFSLLPVPPKLDGRVWYNKRRKNHESGLPLEHVYPAEGPAPSSPPYQMLINHGLPRSKLGDTRSKSTKWRVMAAYQNNNKKHEKFSKSRRKNPYLSICSIAYANNF